MTIQEAKLLLINHFSNNKYIRYDDLPKLIKSEKDKEVATSAILLALSELVSDGVIGLNPIYDPNNKSTLIWNLKTEFSNMEQKVSISGELAQEISFIVNSFIELVNEENTVSTNPLDIKEQDIAILCDIVQMISEKQSQDEHKK